MVSSQTVYASQDDQNMAALIAGDSHAMSRIMGEWQRPVIAFLARSIRCQSLVDDLTQETFIRILTRSGTFQFGGTFRNWLFTIANSCLVDHVRHNRHSINATESAFDAIADTRPEPSTVAERGEFFSRFNAALDKLTEKQADAFRRCVEGKPQPNQTAREHLRVARVKLAEVINRL